MKRRKLVDKIDADARQDGGRRLGPGVVQSQQRVPSLGAGILITGELYPLAGEPPVATTAGWGRVSGLD